MPTGYGMVIYGTYVYPLFIIGALVAFFRKSVTVKNEVLFITVLVTLGILMAVGAGLSTSYSSSGSPGAVPLSVLAPGRHCMNILISDICFTADAFNYQTALYMSYIANVMGSVATLGSVATILYSKI